MDGATLPLTLTVNEAAEQLRISRRSVFKLLADGRLASVKIGRSRRIPRRAIVDYLDGLQDRSA